MNAGYESDANTIPDLFFKEIADRSEGVYCHVLKMMSKAQKKRVQNDSGILLM